MIIPTLPFGEIIDEDRTPTDQELTFRQNLISELNLKAGEQGLVAPTQDALNIALIANNTLPDGTYTMGYGRFLYDSTNNRMLVSIDNGLGQPIFKELVLV